ncbi:MAG: hypothetical protein AAF467_06060 [Actinomycetota bacterium]
MGGFRTLVALAIPVLATVVLVEGVRTSSASFSATTSNGNNLWATVAIGIDLDPDSAHPDGHSQKLFLSGENLVPGQPIQNCVSLTINTTASPDLITVRLHGQSEAAGDLDALFDVMVEHVEADGPCAARTARSVLYRGSLRELTARHGSYEAGLSVPLDEGSMAYLRFTGEVEPTDAAQGRGAAYTITIEARP